MAEDTNNYYRTLIQFFTLDTIQVKRLFKRCPENLNKRGIPNKTYQKRFYYPNNIEVSLSNIEDFFFQSPVINCNKILVQNQLTINLVNMIFSSTQQIRGSFNQISAVRFFSSQQEIGLLQYAFILPA